MAILSGNPSLQWRSASRADAPIPVEFVTEVPKPPAVASQLAPSAPGAASAKDKGYGPGEASPEKIKAGLPDAAKAAPPAAPIAPSSAGTAGLRPARAPKRRAMSAARRAKISRMKALAREEAARRAETLRVERAEAARLAAEAARARREEARRLASELAARRAESARLKALHVAQAKAARARRRAEVEQQLASLPNPDVELSAVRRGGPPARRRLAGTRWRGGAFGAEAALESDLRDAVASAPGPSASLAGRSPAVPALDGAMGAAGLAGFSPAGNPGFARDGRGGADDADQRPAGGGFEDGGGGPVSWLVEGPVGNRKVLKRILPRCPDWVSQRGLELTVQLRFQVLESGAVKTAVVLKRTSGFPDIDRLAIEALRRWRFQPIHSGVGLASPEAWGVISFKFLMG